MQVRMKRRYENYDPGDLIELLAKVEDKGGRIFYLLPLPSNRRGAAFQKGDRVLYEKPDLERNVHGKVEHAQWFSTNDCEEVIETNRDAVSLLSSDY